MAHETVPPHHRPDRFRSRRTGRAFTVRASRREGRPGKTLVLSADQASSGPCRFRLQPVANPIDRFISAKLASEGIKPAPPADRRTLIRRLYLDLIGLPPSPAEVQDFLADQSPDATDKLVDRLLASPHYGQRSGRHWLDVVRFAETNGYERDGDKPNAWRYRDYVINALNHDKPYSRFLTEQLAGDEIERSDAAAQIATTFLRLGTWDDEPAEPAIDRYDQLDDVLGTAATAFLGITLRCARCHDHKFEPFSQNDYYRMLAVFEPLKRPQNGRTELDRPVGTEAELAAYEKSLARNQADFAAVWPRIEALLKPEIDELLSPAQHSKDGKAPRRRTSLPPIAVATFRLPSAERTAAHRTVVKHFAAQLLAEARELAPPEVQAALRPLEERLAAIEAAHKELPRAYIWYEEGPQGPVTHVLKRGSPDQKGPVAEPGLPVVLVRKQPGTPSPTPRSSGRRLWLAHWLTSPENPLVARVIVNRIWQSHFGRGLVASTNDLGVMGDEPIHPELLDWLASELVAGGWRLKPLHRLIVQSQTYQRSSAFDALAAKVDPENTLLWRHRPRRLEAEVVRDSILAVVRLLEHENGRPRILPHSSGRGPRRPVRARPGLGKIGRARTGPPQHLYLRQAQPGRARNRAPRRARLHQQLRAADRFHNGPSSTRIPERVIHPRTNPPLRIAAARRSRPRTKKSG